MSKKDLPAELASPVRHTIVGTVTFWLSVSLLVLVPLAFSASVHRMFSLPKFLILLTGSFALVPLLVPTVISVRRYYPDRPGFNHLLLVSLYVATIAVATAFGATPVASLVGSFENQMGLVTRLCFYVCFLAMIFGIGRSWKRLMQTLWAMALAGVCVATYAFAQFFGRDPFLSAIRYASRSLGETILRPIGTLGHADYLGNFLLYTTPLSVGLALHSRERPRHVGIIAAAVSIIAIGFSGTRGAWLGLVAGGVVFVLLEVPRRFGNRQMMWSRPVARRLAIACAGVLVSVLLIASNPASRAMVVRARLIVTEGFTGAGRTVLWRDSLRMVPEFVVVGCGPEGFRRAFLAHKSKELARLAPNTNNESSHNSYLDAAICFGLPGAVLYAAIIVSAFLLLARARRRMTPNRSAIVTGIMASFAAVIVHNLVIFDQIPTGLYFFAFLALAYVVANVEEVAVPTDAVIYDDERSELQKPKADQQTETKNLDKHDALAIALSGLLLLVGASYSGFSMYADNQINKALVAANEGDLDGAILCVNKATSLFPHGVRDMASARALTLCAERISERQKLSLKQDRVETLSQAKAVAIERAMMHAGKSLTMSLEPDSNNLLLAYLAFLAGDKAKLRVYASEAVRLDPYFPNSRWLLSELYLAEGDRERAAREAESALEISPTLGSAKSALMRARGETVSRASAEKLLELGRQLVNAGKTNRAETILLRALRRAKGQCAECHRLLAMVYEKAELFEDAIAEWETFLRESPAAAANEEVSRRIELLKQKTAK